MSGKIRIGIIIGSDTDLKSQCKKGLLFLQQQKNVEVGIVITASIHRNTKQVLQLLEEYTSEVDVWIIGAGWANHLTGTCDAYLRHTMKNTTPVIGVAFRDYSSQTQTLRAINDKAAGLSIIAAPGTQVIYENEGHYDMFLDSDGFLRACKRAARGTAPLAEIREPKAVRIRKLEEAIQFIEEEQEA